MQKSPNSDSPFPFKKRKKNEPGTFSKSKNRKCSKTKARLFSRPCGLTYRGASLKRTRPIGVWALGNVDLGLGFGIWGLGVRRVGGCGLGLGAWGLGLGSWGLLFGVWGLGFGVRDLGFGVRGSKLRVGGWGSFRELELLKPRRSRPSSRWGLALRFEGCGLRVEGSRLMVEQGNCSPLWSAHSCWRA